MAWGTRLHRISLPFLRHARRTLFGRTLLFMTLVLLAGAVVLGLAAWHYSRVAAGNAYDRLLTGGVVQVAEDLYVQGGMLALDPPVAAFATLSAYDLVYYKVIDPRGIVIAGYPDLHARATLAEAQHGPVLEDGTYRGQRVRMATIARHLSAPSFSGWALVTIAQTRTAREALADALTLKVGVLILVMCLLAIGASAWAIRRGLRPLAKIETIILNKAPNDLSPLTLDTPGEMHAIIGAINVLMQRLANRFAVMQRFIADAAHQIRTPLATLDAQIELLQGEPDAQRRQARMENLQTCSRDLGRLTGQLLNHAMVIHRSEAMALADIELNALVKDVLGRSIPLAGDHDIGVAFESDAPQTWIKGDSVSVREALSNVIHNALVHGAADNIFVRVASSGTDVVLSVADNGPGIPQADWLRVRQPFYRLDDKREGSGLGLAIVDEVMRSHGGELRFRFPENGGFIVELRFPPSPASRQSPYAATRTSP